MRHPKRLLSAYLDGELPQRQRAGLEAHLRRCPACRAEIYGQQELRRRMNDLPQPAPDLQLRSRILSAAAEKSRKEQGSEEERRATAEEAAGSGAKRTAPAHRVLASAGVLAVLVMVLAAAGYALGGPPPPAADTAAAMTAGWAAPAGDDAAVLSEADLLALRSAGWDCPVLPELGFGLVRASGHRVGGSPALKLELSNGHHSLVIFEQPGDATQGQAGPVSAVSGGPADASAYTLESAGGYSYWLRAGNQLPAGSHTDSAARWEAVVPVEGADYTLTSDLPASAVGPTVNQLVVTHDSRVRPWQQHPPENLLERIQRGLTKIMTPGGIW